MQGGAAEQRGGGGEAGYAGHADMTSTAGVSFPRLARRAAARRGGLTAEVRRGAATADRPAPLGRQRGPRWRPRKQQGDDAMAMHDMNELFMHFLKDIYYAERQILKTLPKMAKQAQSEKLKQALTHHREETQQQIERLQQVFELMGKRAQGVTCEAINGIIEEGDELAEEFKEASPTRDAGIIANGQAVEHYEMARYGTLIAWAKAAGQTEVAKLLEQTLQEEKKADTLLTELANSAVNPRAKAA
jgi:ferritin-like metal-binding protein YciE